MCACVSIASDSSETIEVSITKLGMVTASDMAIYHVFILLNLTLIQGHIDLNHENHTFWIISDTVQAIHIKFAVNIIRLKRYILFSQPDDLSLRSRSQVRFKHD